jgi:hypothetical protein
MRKVEKPKASKLQVGGEVEAAAQVMVLVVAAVVRVVVVVVVVVSVCLITLVAVMAVLTVDVVRRRYAEQKALAPAACVGFRGARRILSAWQSRQSNKSVNVSNHACCYASSP